MIQRGSSGKKLFDKIPPITIADSKKKKRERKRSFNFLSEIWNFDAAVPEHQLRRRAERHSRWNLSARNLCFPFVENGKLRLGDTRWQSLISLLRVFQRSSRYTGQAGSCELICQFIRQRNSDWATRAFVDIYIYLFFFLSNPLISFSFSLYALLLVGRSRIPSWSRSTTLSSEISVRTTTRTATTLRNKQRAFLSRVTWEESSLSELGFAVGRDSHDHLVFTVAQRALKLKRIPFPECHREEGRRLPL